MPGIDDRSRPGYGVLGLEERQSHNEQWIYTCPFPLTFSLFSHLHASGYLFVHLSPSISRLFFSLRASLCSVLLASTRARTQVLACISTYKHDDLRLQSRVSRSLVYRYRSLSLSLARSSAQESSLASGLFAPGATTSSQRRDAPGCAR